jgi:hypothetical protein
MLTILKTIAIVAVCIAAAFAWSQEKAEGTKKAEKNPADQQSAATSPPISINVTVSDNLNTKTSDGQHKTADESPKWTDELLAFFTGLLVLVTGGLIWVGELQRRQLKATADLMNEEFLVTHRPQLIVRRVCFNPTKPGHVQYVITNAGESEAEIVDGEVRAYIDVRSHRPFFPVYKGDEMVTLGGLKVPIRDQLVCFAPCPGLSDKFMELIDGGSHGVWIVGWFKYRNKGGATGYTAFGRVYDPGQRGFLTIEGERPEHDKWEYRV